MYFPTDEFERQFHKVLKEHYEGKIWIMEGVGNIPTFDFTYVNPLVIITVCTSGWIKGNYDLRPIEIHKGDLSVLLPEHLISFHQRSQDFDCICILLTKEFGVSMREANSLKAQIHFSQNGIVSLIEDEYATTLHAIEVLRFMMRKKTDDNETMIRTMFSTLFNLFCHFEAIAEKPKAAQSRQEHVFEQFHDAIVKYHRESREVIFYADKLCITPKYLSAIIKQVSGKSANDWINDYVMRETKAMLKTQKSMTIQEISDIMGFPDQATFSKFFKKHEGCTPTDYRMK